MLTIVLCNIPVLVYLLVVSEISKLDSGKNIVSAAQKAEDRLIMDSKKRRKAVPPHVGVVVKRNVVAGRKPQ